MNRELFKITIDGIKGRKKISILFVIIFTVSFAFGIITLSITSSMNRTNEQLSLIHIFKCPDCGREIKLFGESNIDETAKELGVEVLGKLPLDTSYAQTADKGEFYTIDNNYLDKAVEVLKNI